MPSICGLFLAALAVHFTGHVHRGDGVGVVLIVLLLAPFCEAVDQVLAPAVGCLLLSLPRNEQRVLGFISCHGPYRGVGHTADNPVLAPQSPQLFHCLHTAGKSNVCLGPSRLVVVVVVVLLLLLLLPPPLLLLLLPRCPMLLGSLELSRQLLCDNMVPLLLGCNSPATIQLQSCLQKGMLVVLSVS